MISPPPIRPAVRENVLLPDERILPAPRSLPPSRLGLASLAAVCLLIVYVPLLIEASHAWAGNDVNTKDTNSHGYFILPIAALLIWQLRDRIRACVPAPSRSGLALLGMALLIETASYLLRLKWFPLLTLVPALAGIVLALHGPALWRVLRFPILFLAFLAPIPNAVTLPASAAIQRASTSGTVGALQMLGVPTVQNGFEIDTPTQSVEVADACSGFKKLTTLLAFATLYGYLYSLSWPRRLGLVLAAIPVALVVNILRIGGLVLIGSLWGEKALHACHDGAEIFVVVVSFIMLTWIGKALGCRAIRFHEARP